MDMEKWRADFSARINAAFPGRVVLLGIQGSRARGEETGDIDVVVVLDALLPGDLAVYRAAVEGVSFRERLCGFVSGKEELAHWDRADLFQFYYDTVVWEGSLSFVDPAVREDARRAAKAGACAIYHACCHNALHARDGETLRALCKAALFVMRARIFAQTGRFVRRTDELLPLLTPAERKIADMRGKDGDIEESSGALLAWAGEMITK